MSDILQTVPQVLGRIDWGSLDLSPKEGFLLSRVDGSSTVQALGEMCGLPQDEAVDICTRLARLGVVSVPGVQPDAAPAAPAPNPEATSPSFDASPAAPAPPGVPVGPPSAVMPAAPQPAAPAFTMADLVSKKLRPASGEALAQAGIGPEEGFLLSRMSGQETGEQVCLVSPFNRDRTLQLLMSLALRGAVLIEGLETLAPGPTLPASLDNQAAVGAAQTMQSQPAMPQAAQGAQGASAPSGAMSGAMQSQSAVFDPRTSQAARRAANRKLQLGSLILREETTRRPDLPQPGENPFVEEDLATDRPIYEVFLDICRVPLVGKLEVIKDSERKVFYCAGPYLADAESNVEGEQFGRLLVGLRKLVQSEVDAAVDDAELRGQSVGTSLLQDGFIGPKQLRMALRFQGEVRVSETFDWQRASYRFTPGTDWLTKRNYLGIPLPPLLYKAVRSKTQLKKIRSELFYDVRKPLAPATNQLVKSDLVRLVPGDQDVFSMIKESSPTINEFLKMRDLDKDQVYRGIYAMLRLGLIELAPDVDPEKAIEERYNELELTWRKWEAMDYFDILDAHYTASPKELEKCLTVQRKRFDPESAPPEATKLVALLKTMTAKVEEAYEHLKEPERFRAYRRQHVHRGKLTSASLLQFQKGEIALFWKREYADAIKLFQSAVEMDPKEPLFLASLGLAVAEAGGTPAARKRGLGMIERSKQLAKARGDDDAAVYLYSGMLFRRDGQMKRAIAEFKAALSIDPKRKDAIKEMALAKKGERGAAKVEAG